MIFFHFLLLLYDLSNSSKSLNILIHSVIFTDRTTIDEG